MVVGLFLNLTTGKNHNYHTHTLLVVGSKIIIVKEYNMYYVALHKSTIYIFTLIKTNLTTYYRPKK